MKEQKTTSAIKIAIIPILLALAASCWLFFVSDLHIFRRTIQQENRHAEIVGAKPLPVAPIIIEIKHPKQYCASVDRAEIDGTDLWIYWHNGCRAPFSFVKLIVKARAPDGTIVASIDPYVVAGEEIEPGEAREFHSAIPADPRAVTLQIWLDK